MLALVEPRLHEEVQFDAEKTTGVDWVSHPSLRHTDTPERIDVVLVNGDPNPNRPDLPPYGAGETMCKPLLAAVANAIFDATGVRLRRVPFRAPRVLGGAQGRAHKRLDRCGALGLGESMSMVQMPVAPLPPKGGSHTRKFTGYTFFVFPATAPEEHNADERHRRHTPPR